MRITVQHETYDVADTMLGTGGFASVYEARGRNGQLVAVKVIDKTTLTAECKLQLHSEEAALRRAQSHPGIIGLIGASDQVSLYFLVLEAAFGGDLLSRVLDQQGLPEREVFAIVSQLMQAVRWLHDRRIVHGDIKPENILCCARDSCRIKLADFGLAVVLPEGQAAVARRRTVGSALYAPPEETTSFAADVWAVGITTYVTLSANFPYGSREDAASLAPSFFAECWRRVSPRAPEFISALLVRDPAHRPSATDVLCLPWMCGRAAAPPPPRALDQQPIVARDPFFACPDVAFSRKRGAVDATSGAASPPRKQRKALRDLCRVDLGHSLTTRALVQQVAESR